jgi:hypothetical protein
MRYHLLSEVSCGGAYAIRLAALLLRGSLITWKRKCGRPECRCARGELHTTPALSYSVGGVTHLVMLHAEALPRVQAALARYERLQAALERRVQASVVALRAQLAREKAAARRQPR